MLPDVVSSLSIASWSAGCFALLLALVAPQAARAQYLETPQVPAAMMDSPALKPPAGANVAIVEFSDLECPACAAANPTVVGAVSKYHVALVRRDLLIPGHVWSPTAAVNARWFDLKAPELGEQYRATIFANQQQLSTTDDLTQATAKFAQDHHVALPFVVDPQGKLADAVSQDRSLARQLGISRTPTFFVVTAHSHDPGHPFVEFTDSKMLYIYLDQAVSATSKPKAAAGVAHKASHS